MNCSASQENQKPSNRSLIAVTALMVLSFFLGSKAKEHEITFGDPEKSNLLFIVPKTYGEDPMSDITRQEWQTHLVEGLKSVRKTWEEGKTARCVIEDEGRVFAILDNDSENSFSCHRYFLVGQDWQISADHVHANLVEALGWLQEELHDKRSFLEE